MTDFVYLVADNPLFVKLIKGGTPEVQAYMDRTGFIGFRRVTSFGELSIVDRNTLKKLLNFYYDDPNHADSQTRTEMQAKIWPLLGQIAQKFEKDLDGEIPKPIIEPTQNQLEKEDTMSTKTKTSKAKAKTKVKSTKAKATAKTKTTAKAKAPTAGRAPKFAGDTRMVWTKKENPFREGTNRHTALEQFKGANGKTVDDFCAVKPFNRSYVSWMVREGLLKAK